MSKDDPSFHYGVMSSFEFLIPRNGSMSAFGIHLPFNNAAHDRVCKWVLDQSALAPRTRGPFERIEVILYGAIGRMHLVQLDRAFRDFEAEIDVNSGQLTIKETSKMDFDELEKQQVLSVFMRLNQDNSELVKLEELDDGSLLLYIDILPGKKPSKETIQKGFFSGALTSPLERALTVHAPVQRINILLPASMIPFKWDPASIMLAFGSVTLEESKDLELVKNRMAECDLRLFRLKRIYPETPLDALRIQEQDILRKVEAGHVVSRRGWLMAYENVFGDIARAKFREQWEKEKERLEQDYKDMIQKNGK